MDGREEETQEDLSRSPGAGEQTLEGLTAREAQAYRPPLPPETPVKRNSRAWLMPVAVGALVAAVGLGSFFGGMAVGDNGQPEQMTAGGSLQSGQDGATPTPGDNTGGALPVRMGTMGEVTAISASSISVEDMMSGEACTYTINASTEILDNGDTTEVSAIEVGDDVMVVPSGSDESVAARIMIDPAGGGLGGQGGTPPGGTAPGSSTDSTSS